MKFVYQIFVLALLTFTFQVKLLAITPEANMINLLYVTPTIDGVVQTRPKFFSYSNNLRHKVGSPYFAKGDNLLVEGTILDINGNPVDNAIIYMWQTNFFGEYNFNLNEESPFFDPNFIGTGTTTTDNVGKFRFITIFPKAQKNRTSFLNIIIRHKLLEKDIYTRLFFENYPLNDIDKDYKKLTSNQKEVLTGKVYFYDAREPIRGKRAVYTLYLNINQAFKR